METDESLQQVLLRLEQRLLLPEVRHSPEELSELLADEFLEFGSDGRIHNKASIIKELAYERTPGIEITDFRLVSLGDDVVLITYLAAFERQDGEIRYSLRSSIWNRLGDSWRMVFHQGTPAPAPLQA